MANNGRWRVSGGKTNFTPGQRSPNDDRGERTSSSVVVRNSATCFSRVCSRERALSVERFAGARCIERIIVGDEGASHRRCAGYRDNARPDEFDSDGSCFLGQDRPRKKETGEEGI